MGGVMRTFYIVIPAKAGIHFSSSACGSMDPGFRRDDDNTGDVV